MLVTKNVSCGRNKLRHMADVSHIILPHTQLRSILSKQWANAHFEKTKNAKKRKTKNQTAQPSSMRWYMNCIEIA